MIRATVGSCTDVGQLRDGNEDSFVAVDGLYFVADGMGGHQGGATASRMAVEQLAKELIDADRFLAAGRPVMVASDNADARCFVQANDVGVAAGLTVAQRTTPAGPFRIGCAEGRPLL